MPFIFRGNNVTPILGNALTAGLYAQVQAAEPTLIPNLYNRWTAHRANSPNLHGTAYRSALGAFSGIGVESLATNALLKCSLQALHH
jgi:hypothetical protein